MTESEINLFKTLEHAGITDSQSYKLSVLKEGKTRDAIKSVHKETNSLIQDRLSNKSLGECIHITGEMRALTDPFHRYMCEQISNKSEEDIFKIVYNLPEEKINSVTEIVEWNLDNWSSKMKNRKWVEELRTIHSIANRSVNLYTLDTSNKIQYSVFGNKYILLQEDHKDKADTKHTWLLESEALNAELTIKASELIKISENVDEGYYGKFTQNIGGISSKRLLNMLTEKNKLSRDILLNDIIAKDFTDDVDEILKSLKIMNFIAEDNFSDISITTNGREFLL